MSLGSSAAEVEQGVFRAALLVALLLALAGCGDGMQEGAPADGREVGTYTLIVNEHCAGPYRFVFGEQRWELARPIPREWMDVATVEGNVIERDGRHVFAARGEELPMRARRDDEFDTTACWIAE